MGVNACCYPISVKSHLPGFFTGTTLGYAMQEEIHPLSITFRVDDSWTIMGVFYPFFF